MKHVHQHTKSNPSAMKNHLIAADFTNAKKMHTFNIQTRQTIHIKCSKHHVAALR